MICDFVPPTTRTTVLFIHGSMYRPGFLHCKRTCPITLGGWKFIQYMSSIPPFQYMADFHYNRVNDVTSNWGCANLEYESHGFSLFTVEIGSTNWFGMWVID